MCFTRQNIYPFFTAVSDFARGCFVALFSLIIDKFNLFLPVSSFSKKIPFLLSPFIREVMSFSSTFSFQSRFLVRKFVPHNSRRTTPRCDFVEFCHCVRPWHPIRNVFFVLSCNTSGGVTSLNHRGQEHSEQFAHDLFLKKNLLLWISRTLLQLFLEFFNFFFFKPKFGTKVIWF